MLDASKFRKLHVPKLMLCCATVAFNASWKYSFKIRDSKPKSNIDSFDYVKPIKLI